MNRALSITDNINISTIIHKNIINLLIITILNLIKYKNIPNYYENK